LLAAWLHDIAKLKSTGPDHNIVGADMAEEILEELGCKKEIIDKVKGSILAHTTEDDYVPKTLEEKIVQSADGLSDFDHFDLACHRGFLKHPPDKVREWLHHKYDKAYAKIMPEAKDLVKERYDAIKVLLED